MIKKWEDKRKIVTIIAAVIAVIAIFLIVYLAGNDSRNLSKYLDLGSKYLLEEDYASAVASFNKAIELDPNCAEAYLGLIEAYEGMGDDEAALEVAKRGFEITGDDRLKQWIDVLESKLKPPVEEIVEENNEDEERDFIFSQKEHLDNVLHKGNSSALRTDCNRTIADTEKLCREAVEDMQSYLDKNPDDEQIYEDYYEILAGAYYLLGDLDKCLEIRTQGYAVTQDERLNPQGYHKDKPDGGSYDFNEYGKMIYSTSGTVSISSEYDGNLLIRETSTDSNQGDDYLITEEFEYEDGRISCVKVYSKTYDDYNYYIPTYSGNEATILVHYINQDEHTEKFIYNEYGNLEEWVR